ncbi:MAG: acyl-CoA dehydrogenase [Actinomycetia bacterium]|nr:acyl-CoA dehydrogenase [Actinomycetes bacterium]
MDFSLTDDQQELAGLAARIFEDRMTLEHLKAIDNSVEWFDRDTWAELAKANLLGVAVPEAYGGLGFGFLEACLILREVGRFVAPVPFAPTVVRGAMAVAEFGSDEQKQRLLPGVVDGSIVLTAALEEFGAPVDAPATVARADGAGWTLQGEKASVPAAHIAAAIIVAARRESEGDVGLFLVDPTDDGVSLAREETMNHEPWSIVVLDGARAELLATGADALEWLVDRATVAACAVSAGVTDRALRITAEYTTTRKQFDRAIGTFQAVGQRMADAFIDVRAIDLTLMQAATHLDEGRPVALEVATAKYWASEGASRVGHAALHVHGGVSIDVDYAIARYFLWAKQLEFTLGGATPQLLRIGRKLAAEPA